MLFDLLNNDGGLEELSGLDSAFLYLETPNAPMHIGSLAVLEGSLSFKDFKDLLLSRIHMVKTMRQKLVEVPLSLDRPYWVEDPDFNIDYHLHHTRLPEPGGWKQLRRLTSRIFSQHLDRNRPLWEMIFVEGLDTIPQVPPGSVAVISKIHHAAIDGMSGVDILGLLFDLTEDTRQYPIPEQKAPPPVPDEVELMMRSAVNFAKRPLKLPRILMETARATLRTGALSRATRTEMPTLPFTAPHTSFNDPISADRIWNTALLSLDRIKKLKRIMDCTVNDIILAICAGAIRRYLDEKHALPNKPVVAMVPVSTRGKDDQSGGNNVSSMFLQLGTDIADPVERLLKIQKNARRGKAYQGAIDAKTLIEYSEFVPFGIAGQAAKLYSRAQLSKRHNPVVNCVITNVPGPQIPLYLAGKRLLALMGSAPILDGLGLMIPVFSYNGIVSISPTSSPNIMPDLDKFTRYIWESANELEAAILAKEAAKPIEKQKEPKVRVADLFAYYQSYLSENPDLTLKGSDIYQFDVLGNKPQHWVFDLKNKPASLAQGESEDAVCKIQMSEPHILSMLSGKMDATTAFMQGKLKIKGDINAAIQFGQVLATLPPPPMLSELNEEPTKKKLK
ncbi:MAG: wax ester/triacylglycerol synthase family O-acyltransferase [Chloroflexota bacterium]